MGHRIKLVSEPPFSHPTHTASGAGDVRKPWLTHVLLRCCVERLSLQYVCRKHLVENLFFFAFVYKFARLGTGGVRDCGHSALTEEQCVGFDQRNGISVSAFG